MNYSEAEVKRKKAEITSSYRKRKYQAAEWLAYCGVILVITFLLVTISALSGAVRGMIDSTPKIEETDVLLRGHASTIYDSTGKAIQTLSADDVSREYVSIDEIPKCMQQAVVAIEDKRFNEHHGVDMMGVLDYIYDSAFEHEKGRKHSTATITQQLVQNQILGGINGKNFVEDVSIAVKEQHLAIQLEDSLDKAKILEYYLNTINLGQNVTGVQEAAKRYFGKNIAEVSISEAAVLAAAVTDSAEYNPITNQEKNAQRRRFVLKSMLDEGYISEDDYEEAIGDNVYLRIREVNDTRITVNEYVDSYYTDAVVDQVIEDLKENLGYSQTEAYNALYHGGLRIYTCQESSLQKICEKVINSDSYYPEEELSGNLQVSFVLMEQSTGKVKAIVGGRGKKAVSQGINRATELKCQPGSVLAVLSAYTPALETAGVTLGCVQDDALYNAKGLENTLLSQGGKYDGLMTLRTAIKNAKNIPAVRTLQDISVQTGFGFLKRFGFTSIVSRGESEDGTVYSDMQLQMALGELNEGVTNLELTAAYAAIANEGVYQKPRFYTRIVDRDGNVLLDNQASPNRIIKKDTAWLLTDVMTDTVKDGNAKAAEFQDIETEVAGSRTNAAAKKDFWFEGYTPYYTAGIWCGTEKSSKKQSDYYVKIWREIMEKIHQHTKRLNGGFKKQANILKRNICSKCGNLAVQGLCDQAVGGNTICKEYFAMGTEPDKNCTCHVKYKFCKESGELASEMCPEEEVYDKVLLQKTEISETADTKNTTAYNISGKICAVHGEQ